MSKFKKKNLDIILDDEIIDSDIDSISIEDLDKDMAEFYINKEKIEAIKAPEDMKLWVREAAKKAQEDMKKEKNFKYMKVAAASVCVILTIGTYNPALAHKLPPLENLFNSINNALNIDEIASFLGIDKIIPKVEVDENDKITVIKIPDYKISKEESDSIESDDIDYEIEIETEVESQKSDVIIPKDEYDAIQFVHRMSNSIIVAKDNRKYGKIEVTPENIDIAISCLQLINDESTRSFIEVQLIKWKEGNFENAVMVHNFVWDILGGEVGKAGWLDKNAIRKLKAKYFN